MPLHIFAHQENHILAALRDLERIPTEPFLALHLSGGTTELVYCHYQGEGIFESHIIGVLKICKAVNMLIASVSLWVYHSLQANI